MDAHTLYHDLIARGFAFAAAGGTLTVHPRGLTAADRDLIRAHKCALVDIVIGAEALDLVKGMDPGAQLVTVRPLGSTDPLPRWIRPRRVSKG